MRASVVVLALFGVASASMSLKLLKDAASKEGAVCLDGTPAGYYMKKGSSTGANKWVLFFEGGAWCWNEDDCYHRSKYEGTGSSKSWGQSHSESGMLSESQSDNPDFYNWNHVYMKYCDGGSFTGDRAEPVTIEGSKVYFRGHRILKAILEDLKALGLSSATEVLLTGCSAGGTSSLIHSDTVHAAVPSTAIYGVAPVSGYFPGHSNIEGVPVYQDQMNLVYHAHNSTGLNADCLHDNAGEEYHCLLGNYIYKYIKANVMLLNSKYDAVSLSCDMFGEPLTKHEDSMGNCSAVPGWQACSISPGSCTKDQLTWINDEWANQFMNFLESTPKYTQVGNGAFLHSCHFHCSEYQQGWNKFKVNGVILSKALGQWWHSQGKDPASQHTFVDCNWSNNACCNPTCC